MDTEEDIKIINNFIQNLENGFVTSYEISSWNPEKVIAKSIKNLLAEREEDKKRIERLQVLEDDLKDKRIVYVDTPEFEEKFIPKQKVKEIFDRLHISDIEPWSTYKVSGDILFDLKELLEDK